MKLSYENRVDKRLSVKYNKKAEFAIVILEKH